MPALRYRLSLILASCTSVGVMCCGASVMAAIAPDDQPSSGGKQTDVRPSNEVAIPSDSDAIINDGVEPAVPADLVIGQLDPDAVFEHVVVGADGVVSAVGGGTAAVPGERLIYSNTLGISAFRFGNGQLVADDITTTAPVGCNLTRFSFKVLGRVVPTDPGGPYTVHYALYDNCPQSVPLAMRSRFVGDPAGGIIIPGTSGEIAFPDDTPRIITHLISFPTAVSLPTNVWLGISFTRANCGAVLGAPTMVGHSADIFDYPGIACISYLGGFPDAPHASFWAEMYGGANCPDSFVAYKAAKASAAQFSAGPNVPFLDDVRLIVNNCQMIGYEVAVRGQAFYQFELVRDCGSGPPGSGIPGTYKTLNVNLNTQPQLQLARFAFDPPIPLNANRLFFRFIVNNATGGVVQAGIQPTIGSSSEGYYLINTSGGCYSVWWPGSTVTGVFHSSITCAGEPAVGACCDVYRTDETGNAVCRDLPAINCPQAPAQHWIPDSTCDDAPFPHPCGLGACCLVDHGCLDLTNPECKARAPADYPRTWRPDSTCDAFDQTCSAGDCWRAHSTPGCSDFSCESTVCSFDMWCCGVEWDTVCAAAAGRFCSGHPRNDRCWSTSLEAHLGPVDVIPNSTTIISDVYDGSTYSNGRSCQLAGSYLYGVGSLWYKFTASHTTARVATCDSPWPGNIGLIEVYRATDNSTLPLACSTLRSIACANDSSRCLNRRNASVCARDLVPGETYYVRVAANSPSTVGLVRLDIDAPCRTSPGDVDPDVTPFAVSTGSPTRINPLEPIAPSPGIENTGSPSGSHAIKPTTPTEPHESVTPFPGPAPASAITHRGPYVRNGFISVQVNVDPGGNNMIGDAANEPSIAIDPTNRDRIVIGWRQFDSPQSDRQAGWAYSHDGGQTWTFPGVIDRGVYRSDPILESDGDGVFYFHSIALNGFGATVFRSFDGGVTWDSGFAFGGGDKPWIAIDKTGGMGQGNLYTTATFAPFRRGRPPTFSPISEADGSPQWGTIDIAPDGSVWLTGLGTKGVVVVRSPNAYRSSNVMLFDRIQQVNLDPGSATSYLGSPNPEGLVGQSWIATNPSASPRRSWIYAVRTIGRGSPSTLDIMFARSRDAGLSWDPPVRINDDPDGTLAQQWFGTMSVAPSGRIDVVWNDTRNSVSPYNSELFYSYSEDGGETWSPNIPVSPPFSTSTIWPGKLGDYYDMVSDGLGAHVAYAATFNGEHDVYYLRLLPAVDCNRNGVYDPDDIASSTSFDTNGDRVPDECQSDFDHDGIIDDVDSDIDGDGVSNTRDLCPFTHVGEPVTPDGYSRADTDGDCVFDLTDFWRFHNCLTGGVRDLPAPLGNCRAVFDRDLSGELDLRDFRFLQNSFEGP